MRDVSSMKQESLDVLKQKPTGSKFVDKPDLSMLLTCWRRERDSLGPVLCVDPESKKLSLRPTFLFVEVNVRGRPLEPRRRAQLIVCSERRVFDEQALRFYAANRTADFSLTMILHTGGKVASEVTQQNILREPRGAAAGSGLAPRVEVHSHASIILHGTHAEESRLSIVPAAEAPRVRELYGIDDVASLPARDATSREVMLTGALERDMVQTVEPEGLALVFVTPLAAVGGDHEYERLLRELREHPQLVRRREDLAREVKNTVSAECARLLEESAAKQPGALESWHALESWVDMGDLVEARGCPRRSREVFASLQACAPALHARISALLERDDREEEAWRDDLLLSALERAVYAARNGRAVAAAVFCHSRQRVEEEDEDGEESGEACSRVSSEGEAPQEEEGGESLGTTPTPRSAASSSSPAGQSASYPDSPRDSEHSRAGSLELVNLQALLAAAESDEDGAAEEEDAGHLLPRLEALRPRELAFVQVLRERVYATSVTLYREDFLSMHFRVDEWYAALAAEPWLERHAFWEQCGTLGLSAVLASTLGQLHTGAETLSLREEIGAVEHWLQQGARFALPREAARAAH